MLIKFETKSARVKGIAFHPRRRWVLASLHNGVIQLWDYGEKVMIDRFDEHKGPVRGLDFHKQQPLFVSGGDDHKIRVWNYKSKRCLFTLEAHDDYIRSTFFHNECPWILSSSDDQTVRIWNWQSRTKVAILTGHTHYVMCAQFHPAYNIIVSASIDQTLRVWNISSLRKKSMNRQSPDDISLGMPEILSKADYDVKPIEAHNSEINWVAFHPNPEKHYMLSSGEDNYIKIWNIEQDRQYEIDTCRGHYNNVNCAIFHPRKNLILSASEDRSIRVWDLDKKSSLHTYRKEVERFWILAAHPKENLFAAGHDTGMMIFKLERERPPFVVTGDRILYIHNNQLLDYRMKLEGKPAIAKMAIALKTKPEMTHHYHKLDVKDDQVLVTIRSNNLDKSVYDLYKLNETQSQRGQGLTAIFIGRSKIAVLDKTKKVIFKTTANQERKFKMTIEADEIYSCGVGKLFVKQGEDVTLWDLEKGCPTQAIKIKAKQIVLSDDKAQIAILGNNKIIVCDKELNIINIITDQRKIKSVSWAEDGVVVYTTPVHLKYALTNGDVTTIQSLDSTMYVVAVRDNCVFCIDRNGEVQRIELDPLEYKFKQAVINNDKQAISIYLKKMKDLKQSDVAFLVKNKHSDLALSFVKDHKTRFPLAIQALRIEDAFKSAEYLNEGWEELAKAAMVTGQTWAVEIAYQKIRAPYKLAMLYLATEQFDKLKLARKMAADIADSSAQFLISIFMKDFEECSKLLLKIGNQVGTNLAYACAKSHGLLQLAESISSSLTEDQRKKLPKIEPNQESWLKSANFKILNPITPFPRPEFEDDEEETSSEHTQIDTLDHEQQVNNASSDKEEELMDEEKEDFEEPCIQEEVKEDEPLTFSDEEEEE